ncbi:hypothetical protein [Microbacterium sp. YY-01]|uniref:hypothetical protein n=1 Tax=Microbacterium sp. YY-01 TaxID=3421634 RepID=UPI003D173DA4
MREHRVGRVVRGLAAASVATFIALLAHVAAGAPMPGWAGVFVPWLFSVLLCIPLVGRRLHAARLAAAVFASQFLFHALFVLGASPTGTLTATGGVHIHSLWPMADMSPDMAAAAAPFIAGPMMWIAHAAASGITSVLLYRGEWLLGLCLHLAAQCRAWLVRRVEQPTVRHSAAVYGWHPDAADHTLPRLRVWLSAVARRGPPCHQVFLPQLAFRAEEQTTTRVFAQLSL